MTDKRNDQKKKTKELINSILSQREEIVKAFIAKYGFAPEEAEQVCQQTSEGIIWFIRKKQK